MERPSGAQGRWLKGLPLAAEPLNQGRKGGIQWASSRAEHVTAPSINDTRRDSHGLQVGLIFNQYSASPIGSIAVES